MYEIEVEVAPAYELITSLYFYINKDRLKIYELGTDWKRKVDECLHPEFKELLKDKRMEVIHRLNLLVHKCPVKRTAEQFISWLKGASPIEIYECMTPWIKSLPMDLKTIQSHFVRLLEEWNLQYFSGLDQEITKLLEEDGEEKRKLMKDMSPVDLVELCTNGVRIESSHIYKILLVPQYHYAPSSVIDFDKGLMTCLYPIEAEALHEPFISKRVIHQLTSLSDSKRMLILKLLQENPKTFTELLSLTNLAKSNLHYHITMLRTAGFIRAHHSGERVELYSLREKAFTYVEDKVNAYLKGIKS